ncbi:MAG: hypothetical protein DRR03_04805 [Gammaproteobacteria bacterium]|nr:MAG: hypothetical protein DRR03_04805 [Gammaproteobacteria bacterium]
MMIDGPDNGTESGREKEVLAPQPGPGSRLGKARVAANMTVEEVAASLNLTLGVVQALERDATDELPAPVFVRGYIMNFARLVGLNSDELIKQYEQVRAPEVPLELRPRPAAATPRIRRGLSLRTIVVVLLVVGAGLASLWWAQGGRLEIGDLTRIGESTLAPVPATPVLAPMMPVPEPVPDVMPNASDPALVGSGPSAGSSVAEDSDTASNPASVVEEVVPVEPAPPPAPTGHRLKLRLSNDVWVEVVDTDGTRLVFDMLRGGTTREVTGEGPFLVLLGKARAVAVELNGRSVDHAAYERKGIARFVLDDEDGDIVTRNP